MTEKKGYTLSEATNNILQLLLAEKRTSLSLMRTGIAVLILPLSVLSLLVATSKYYAVADVLSFLIPLGVLLTFLVILGIYLVGHAMHRMHHSDLLIQKIKSRHPEISDYIE